MRRRMVGGRGVALMAIVLGGCGGEAPSAARVLAPNASATATVGDTAWTEFKVNPWATSVGTLAGSHKVSFPAGSICDPLLSTYGPSEWDQPCLPATLPLTIRAKSWTDANGHPRVDFSPALRFVPTTDSKRFVTLTLSDANAALDPTSRILYCATPTQCVDESTQDRTESTKHDSANGWITRRIKHFSGYNVTAGFAPSEDALSLELQ